MYRDEIERVEAARKYLNYSLANDIFTIYASVDTKETFYRSRLAAGIADCDRNIVEGNLMLFELTGFLESALKSSWEPFDDLKALLAEIVKERIVAGHRGEIMLFGDCADYLSRHGMLEQCIGLERWWDNACSELSKSGVRITVVCPHSSASFEGKSRPGFEREVSRFHSVVLRASHR